MAPESRPDISPRTRPSGRARRTGLIVVAGLIVLAIVVYGAVFLGMGYDNRTAETDQPDTRLPTGSTPGTLLPAQQ